MKREWEPGDVAVLDFSGSEVLAMRVTGGCIALGHGHEDHWHCASGGWASYADSIRPLVVIDPEDRRQVERFREIASRLADEVPYDETGDRAYTDAMQAALREFANPTPPIEEPQGLGAVVEDARGDLYVRCVSGPSVAYWHCTTDAEGDRRWPEIAVVRVLSEGVTHD